MTAMAPEPCEHHFVNQHKPGHILYWIRICSLCHEADWDDLDRQITDMVYATRVTQRQDGRKPAEQEEPRYEFVNGTLTCLDCGNQINLEYRDVHTRFHSILSAHAWALAVLQTSHISALVHDRYDVIERIKKRKFDSWSGEAFNDVVRNLERGER